jgi:hypothetical protein
LIARSLPQLFYAWFNTDTYRLPLQSIFAGSGDSPPARVTQGLELSQNLCFSSTAKSNELI